MQLTFGRINKFCDGWPARDIKTAERLAEGKGYDFAYGEGKKFIDHYVGFHRRRTDYPDLRTREAHEIVLARLIRACERGDVVYETRQAEDAELEKQGLFTVAKAQEMACFKDSLACCTPERCMCWRMVDNRHGHCALIARETKSCAA